MDYSLISYTFSHYEHTIICHLTSSSAFAKRSCDASCLSVVSFNSTKCRVESFIVSYAGYRFITACKLTAIIQSRRLTLFGHIMRTDDNANAKRILFASPPTDWRRQLGRPRITWLSTVQQDLKQHHLTLPEAAALAQNRPLWKMMLTYGATQS